MTVKLEQIKNNAQTTTGGAIDGTTDPVTFTVASASGFPSDGNFTVAIDAEFLKVTGVSGTSFTAARAQSGSSIVAHSSGALVTLVADTRAVLRLLAEQNLGGVTAANRPAAGQEGRLFFPSDGSPCIFRDNGSAWEVWAHGKGPFFPPLGDFATWVNQGSRGSIDETGGYSCLIDAGPATNSEVVIARVKSVPATPWTLTAVFEFQSGGTPSGHGGMCLRDSASGRIKTIGMNRGGASVNAGWAVFNFASPTVFNASLDVSTLYNWTNPIIIRVTNDGTNLTIQYSSDFRNWHTEYTEAVSGNYLANIDQAGFYLDNYSAAALAAVANLNVYHLKFT